MKTQIITLASHDGLVSVRDRMSWAKSPQILLVWPARERVALRATDLRILSQHARYLGAQLALVTRRPEVVRDAKGLGIPVFRSAADAQRATWSNRSLPFFDRRLRTSNRTAELRIWGNQFRSARAAPGQSRVLRIGMFAVGVMAVLSIALLFVPRATILITPTTMDQESTLDVPVVATGTSVSPVGSLVARSTEITLSGTRAVPIQSFTAVPQSKARGTVRFQNLGLTSVALPAGTLVFTASPETARFVTLTEAQLEARAGAVVEVEIEALEAGDAGNVPANAIHGIQGQVGASTAVTNLGPTSGGSQTMEPVPSESDRERLRADLLGELEVEAEGALAGLIADGDVILPGTLALVSVEEEAFEPAFGEPASVLSLRIRATFEAQYLEAGELRRVAEASLNGLLPAEFEPRADSLQVRVAAAAPAPAGGVPRLTLEASRLLARRVSADLVIRAAQGRSAQSALDRLRAQLPLAEAPEIRLEPAWWPWLPLIPFRISVVAL